MEPTTYNYAEYFRLVPETAATSLFRLRFDGRFLSQQRPVILFFHTRETTANSVQLSTWMG